MMVAFGSILNVIIVSVLFFAMFGIIGVNYFKGKYFDCQNTRIPGGYIDHKWDCLNAGGDWVREFMNFDSTL